MKKGLFLFCAFFALSTAKSQNLTDSLVVHYSFDGNVQDASGRSNNGTANNVTYSSDRYGITGKSAVFNGTNAFVSIPYNDLFNTEYTYSFWFYLSDNLAWGSKAVLLTIGGTTCDQCPNLTNNYYGYTGINAGGYHTNSGTFNINYNSIPLKQTWNHLVQIKSGDSLKMFLNGQKIAIASSATPCYSGSNPQGRIGARIDNSQYFNGRIDELRIYKRALTDAEVRSLYNECNIIITQQPTDTNILESRSGMFKTLATGGTLNYQWQINNGTGFSSLFSCYYTNTTTNTLHIPFSNMSMNGAKLRCIVSNPACKDTTAEVTLTVDTVIYNNVYDTLTVYDSIQVVDTLYTYEELYVYDTVAVYDSIYINVFDTSYVTIYDSVYVSVTDTLIIYATFTGMPAPGHNYIRIYPNPANDHVFIDNGNFATMPGCSVRISNATGQTVFASPINQQVFKIDLSTWTGKGLYYVQILDASNLPIEIRKIVLR